MQSIIIKAEPFSDKYLTGLRIKNVHKYLSLSNFIHTPLQKLAVQDAVDTKAPVAPMNTDDMATQAYVEDSGEETDEEELIPKV